MRKIPLPESDADHMHRVAVISMLNHSSSSVVDWDDSAALPSLDYSSCPELHPANIDAAKLLRMALTHDICEAIAGDITPHCCVNNERSREELEGAAMQHISRIVGEPLGSELADLWLEYEQQLTPTSVVVKDIDKFEMLAQALEYEQEHLKECPAGVDPLQDTPRSTKHNSISTNKINSNPPPVTDEPLRDFFQRQQGQMKTPLFQNLDAELRARRTKMLAEKKWGVTEGEK